MTTQEFKKHLDDFIETNELSGRSFTNGVALYNMLRNGYFLADNTEQVIEDRLIQHIASDLDIDQETVSAKFTFSAMNEYTDIAVLDEIAKELAGESEGE